MRNISDSPFEKSVSIYDCVHGHIDIYEPEAEIINTTLFQRLRGIVQLGMGSLVYPGASHTRFSHSLGVLFIISKMLEFLKVSPPKQSEMQCFIKQQVKEEQKFKRDIPPSNDPFFYFTIRMAALLHDIGHFPFSHVFEGFYKEIEKHPHEFISAELVGMKTVRDILVKHHPKYNYDIEIIQKMIKGDHLTIPLRYVQLLNSKIDADRIDYLLRDSYNCGLIYGNIDIDRIFRNIQLVKYKGTNVIAISNKANISVDQFLVARYYMYNTVYYHKTTFCFEEILRKIVKKSGSLGHLPSRKYVWLDGENNPADIDSIRKETAGKITAAIKSENYSNLTFNDIVIVFLDKKNPVEKRIIDDNLWKSIDGQKLEEIFCKYTDHFVWTVEYQNYVNIIQGNRLVSLVKPHEVDLRILYEHLFRRTPIKVIYGGDEIYVVKKEKVKDEDGSSTSNMACSVPTEKAAKTRIDNLTDEIQLDPVILGLLNKPAVLTCIRDEYPILDDLGKDILENEQKDEQSESILKNIFLFDKKTSDVIPIIKSNLSILKILPEFKKFFFQVYSDMDGDVDRLKTKLVDLDTKIC